MRYASVCDGIGAAHVAWAPLGWECAWRSEIAPFPESVVSFRHPSSGPNLGDMTRISDEETQARGAVSLLVGGTPCQSFSVAGLRKGLADHRGNLALVFLVLAARARARWVVWENVPGVLSSGGGRDFGALLGGLAELGYGFAWRVLDAQFFGVPQRRRRVFLVGHLGDWRRAAAVLFERHGLSWNPPPSRGPEEIATALSATGVGTCGADDNQAQGNHIVPVIASEPIAFDWQSGGDVRLNISESATSALQRCQVPAVWEPDAHIAFSNTAGKTALGLGKPGCPPVTASHGNPGQVAHHRTGVRRLTPRECERLQGFPDDYTLVPHKGKMASDAPRYRALGNSMAVPVMRWIGERIDAVDLIR